MSVDQVNSVVAVVGSPNSGKTTLFNWLTGSRFKTVNYPGSTVESHQGRTLPVYGDALSVLDTPGVYSLQPQSRDEEVTVDFLLGKNGPPMRAAIVVVDGMQLRRQLYLVRQIQEMKIPFVLAVTMDDLMRKNALQIDVDRLSERVKAPVVFINGQLGGGVQELVQSVRALLARLPESHGSISPIDWTAEKIDHEQHLTQGWARDVLRSQPHTLSAAVALRRLDHWLLHPVVGVLAFISVMTLLFSSIFWAAAPAMDFVDALFSQMAEKTFGLLGHSAWSDFLANGVVAGFGAILVFVPQIFILFLGFNLLEDSGYLARAATIVDRPFQRIGLSGRAFVPLLSGFACAVPGIMAARNLRSGRERWITVFILPLMTCSARLPVYALLLTFLFAGEPAWKPGLALAGLYLASLLLGAVAAAILNKMIRKTRESHFMMELPYYRAPKMRVVLRSAFSRTLSYVTKAGPTIFVLVLVLWTGTHFPRVDSGAEVSSSLSHETLQLEQSYVGRVGQWMEPVFEPMGLDWRAGLGLLSAFVAREVFVSSLAVIFNIAGGDDGTLQNSLLEKMRSAVGPNGSPLFTTATVMGLIVFFMIALQCLSTTGVTAREMGSWRYAFAQLVVWNVVAYVFAVLVVQIMS